ncbi:hypothetical protein IGS67_08690 [Flavimobilis sp. GY10621]|uniref:Uncharacterized protein n=1 Tax=Flavimobilis rhizosphaerae TaxID=2775421 RepID=A0ABR9DRH5_9MICO|nr:hypothetical protein [Flavimobilis rhizosphaerae]MBD9699564.1 hypothetical protein [Flavimobilis rhizosphaerae]
MLAEDGAGDGDGLLGEGLGAALGGGGVLAAVGAGEEPLVALGVATSVADERVGSQCFDLRVELLDLRGASCVAPADRSGGMSCERDRSSRFETVEEPGVPDSAPRSQ